jgi:hypothetical protein
MQDQEFFTGHSDAVAHEFTFATKSATTECLQHPQSLRSPEDAYFLT